MKDKNHEQLATKIMMNALEGVKAQIRKAYDKGYEDGKADTPFTDTEEAEEKAYNRGLNEAWKAAKKIAGDMTDGGYSLDELHEIFNETLNRIIFKRNTASEAIAKIKAYEDKQKQDDWRDIPSEEMTLEQQPVTTTNNDEPITVIYPTIVCDDAISRQAVLNILFYKSDNNGEVRLSKELRDRIKNLPSVTPQPKTGEWIHLRCDMYECSKCRKIYTSFEKGECDAFYCPKCGARMVEPQESEK